MTLLLLGAFASTVALAAPTTAWTTHSPGGEVDAGFLYACGPSPMLLDAAGNSILVRVYSGDFLSIAKFSPSGELLWRKDDYETPRTHFFPRTWPCTAALDAAGDLFVASSGQTIGQSSVNRKILTVKYSGSDGEPLWAADTDTLIAIAIRGLAVDALGDVWMLAAGSRVPPLSGTRSVIIKYRGATGELAWPERDNGELQDIISYRMLALDAQGDAVVAMGDQARKLAGESGDTVWTATVPGVGELGYGSTHLMSNGLIFDAAGDVLIVKGEDTARVDVAENSYYLTSDFVTVKLSGATGAPIWTGLPNSVARYGGMSQGHDMPAGIALDSAGNVFVHGSSQAGGLSVEHFDFATLKYDAATGATAWGSLPDGAMRYDGVGNGRDAAAAVAVDSAGDVYVTGSSTNLAGDEDILTRKYSGITGQPLWLGLPDYSARYDGPVGGFDAAIGLAIGPMGNVFVAAYEEGLDNDDQILLKHDAATGAMLWTASSEPIVARTERLYDFHTHTTKIDAAGNAFVAGTSFNGLCDEWLLMKVSPDGTRLWSRGFAGPRTAFESPCGYPYDLVLDADGNAFVTGELSGHIATAKFSGIDGAPLWTDQPDGIARHEAPRYYYAGRLLAVDSQGDVVMAAGLNQYSSVPVSYLHTVKYEGDTGHRIWSGQHGDNDFFEAGWSNVIPTGLAIDAQDNVIVTADAPDGNNFTFRGIVTVKYGASSGLPLWSDQPLGAARFPACSMPVLALDPAQDVVVGCTVRDKSSQPRDFATIKYLGATGQPAWSQLTDGSARYDGPDSLDDKVKAIAVDRHGDVLVSGESLDADGQSYWATIKYSGESGAPLWSQGAVRENRQDLRDAWMELSLLDDQAFVLSGQQRYAYGSPRGQTRGGWRLHDVSSGALVYGETLPVGTTLGAAIFVPDNDLLVTGTANDDQESATVYVIEPAEIIHHAAYLTLGSWK